MPVSIPLLVALAVFPPMQTSSPAEPDGRLIVHARERGGPFCLWRLELAADGLAEEPRQLTRGPGWSFHPMRQAHGERIVYFSRSEAGVERREMGSDGSVDRPHRPDSNADRDVVVSPGGRWIAYAQERDGVEHLYLRPLSPPSEAAPVEGQEAMPVPAGPGEERALTTGSANHLSPRWCPDGARLLIRSDRDGEGMAWARSARPIEY